MNLLDRLIAAADKLPASHVPPLSQVLPALGSIVAYLEHGENFLTAAEHGAEEVVKLYAPVAEEIAATAIEAAVPAAAPIVSAIEHVIAPAPAAPAAPAAPSADAQRILELEAELQAAQIALASAQRTVPVVTAEAAA